MASSIALSCLCETILLCAPEPAPLYTTPCVKRPVPLRNTVVDYTNNNRDTSLTCSVPQTHGSIPSKQHLNQHQAVASLNALVANTSSLRSLACPLSASSQPTPPFPHQIASQSLASIAHLPTLHLLANPPRPFPRQYQHLPLSCLPDSQRLEKSSRDHELTICGTAPRTRHRSLCYAVRASRCPCTRPRPARR